jgi:hypothetical protein
MLDVMSKTPLIVFIVLLTLGSTINAAEQPKLHLVPKTLTACALVTKAEIAEAIGSPIGKGTPTQDRDMDICTFTTPKGNEVSIYVTRSPAKRNLNNVLAEARKAMPTATIREVPGLGEKALLVEQLIGGTLLSVYRAGDTLVVSVPEAGDRAKTDAAAEKIARKAFERF